MGLFYYYGHIPAGKVIFELSSEVLASTPEWVVSEPNPPLPARKALELGQQALRTSLQHEIEWVLISLELIENQEARRWFYKLNYQLLRNREVRTIVIMGKPYYLPVVVMMDGIVLEPPAAQRLPELQNRGII